MTPLRQMPSEPTRQHRRRLPALAALLVFLTAPSGNASPQGIQGSVVVSQAAGITRLKGDSPGLAAGLAGGNVTYHGGLVQHVQKVYTIFWQPSGQPAFPPGFQGNVNQFIQDLNQSPYYAIASQYSDATGPISTSVVFAGTYLDTLNAIPNDFGSNDTATLNDVLAEVESARGTNGWATDVNAYFQVFTPAGIGASTQYCGFHAGVFFNTGSPAYSLGLDLFPRPGCFPGGPYPNDQFSDSAINTTAHEVMESVTDPYGDAWFFVNGSGEVGDLCNFDFGTRSSDGGNLTLSGRRYLAQRIWSNAESGCSLGAPAGSPPVVTANPASVTIFSGQIASFSAAASGSPAPSVQWQVSSAGGYTNIPGATATTYSFTVAPADSGKMFRAVFTNTLGSATTTPATLTVHLRVPGDLDGDGLTDLLVWRPSTGTWFGLTSSSGYNPSAAFGKAWGSGTLGDKPFTGDIDGDGLLDLIVWRPTDGTWYWLTSSTGYSYSSAGVKQWGNASLGDIPMVADMDGDGKADLVIWRQSNGTFYWLTSSTGYSYTAASGVQWGNASLGDRPLLADFDGDGKGDLAIWRASNGTWYWLTSSSGYSHAAAMGVQWGNSTFNDVPLTGDIDGDGRADLIIWRPTDGTWYWLTSSTGYGYGSAGAKQWGNASLGDIPLIGDMDGDGKTDLVVWRQSSGTFYWLTSMSGYSYSAARAVAWGTSGDIPLW